MLRAIPTGGSMRPGHVYIGHNPRHGQTRYGNKVLKCSAARSRSAGGALREAHECCVMEYAEWLAAPAQKRLRLEVRRRLKGKTLACHYPDGLPCHGEVLAALANDSEAITRAFLSIWAPGRRADGTLRTLAAVGLGP